MAKKKKGIKAEKINRPSLLSDSSSSRMGAPSDLIRFDRNTNIFLGACLFLFLLFVLLKWHNSSIPEWNRVANDGNPDRGIIRGKPHPIRSDEWMVITAFTLSQLKQNMPLTNEALGFGTVPLLFSLPTHHLLGYARPAFWGYYFLDDERGFSWQWNFKIFPFIAVTFLLLMLFTSNNFLLSLFGSLWLYLSSAIQWWSINTELFTFGCLTLLSFIYILFSDRPRNILVGGIGFVLSAYSFAMVLYPAYQVPLAYFLLALLVGYFLWHRKVLKQKLKAQLTLKLATLGISLVALAGIMLLFLHVSKETIEVVSNTVYPGKRISEGGIFDFVRLFVDSMSPFLSEGKYPAKWENICEASSFLMIFPFASIILLVHLVKKIKVSPVLLALFIFQVIIFIWLFLGLPDLVAKLTFFALSPVKRTFYIFGFANVFGTILFLSHYKRPVLSASIRNLILSASGLLILSFVLYTALNSQVENMFSSKEILFSSLFVAVVLWLMLYFPQHAFFRISFYSCIALFVLPNAGINPLCKGLTPFTENGLYKAVSRIHDQDPNGRWIIFGPSNLPNYLKAAGINCFNGVLFAPPLEQLHILDPTMNNDSIYNRYAHTMFFPMLNNQDSAQFKIGGSADSYSVTIHPCSPKLEQLNIDYFMFAYKPSPEETACMTLVQDMGGYSVYKRNEG